MKRRIPKPIPRGRPSRLLLLAMLIRASLVGQTLTRYAADRASQSQRDRTEAAGAARAPSYRADLRRASLHTHAPSARAIATASEAPPSVDASSTSPWPQA